MKQTKRKAQHINFDVKEENIADQLGLTTERANDLRNTAMKMVEETEAKNPLYLIGEVSKLATTEEELTFLMVNIGFWRADRNAKKEIRTLRETVHSLKSRIGEQNGTIAGYQQLAEKMLEQELGNLHDMILSKVRKFGGSVPPFMFEHDNDGGMTMPGIRRPLDGRNERPSELDQRTLSHDFKARKTQQQFAGALDEAINRNLHLYASHIKEIHIGLDTREIEVVFNEDFNAHCSSRAFVRREVRQGIDRAVMEAMKEVPDYIK